MGKISQYTAVTTPTDADELVVVQAGVTKKITLATLKAAGGFAAYVKNNLEGTTAPGVTDDTITVSGVASACQPFQSPITETRLALGAQTAK